MSNTSDLLKQIRDSKDKESNKGLIEVMMRLYKERESEAIARVEYEAEEFLKLPNGNWFGVFWGSITPDDQMHAKLEDELFSQS